MTQHIQPRTLTDEKRRIIDFQDTTLELPAVGIFDEPTRHRAPINQQWDAIVAGAIRTMLTTVAGWYLAQDEDYDGIQQVLEWLASEAQCTIEDVLSDEEFFQNEYIPQTFGDWYNNTVNHNTELNTAYDGTPQSIGSEIPLGTPDPFEENALCYALQSFVSLYASAKVCIIQSRNFLQVAWDEVLQAVNAVYNATVQSLGFIYTPNLYSCFVDPETAISVLQDAAAIEELACYLFEELRNVAMSQANFDNAIASASMTLTGNAQLIACILQNDNNLDVYLNFLEAYNIALIRQQNGDALDCPCMTGLFWILDWNFANGLGDFQLVSDVNGQLGEIDPLGVKSVRRGTAERYHVMLNFDAAMEIDNLAAFWDRHEVNGGAGNNQTYTRFELPNLGGTNQGGLGAAQAGGTTVNVKTCIDNTYPNASTQSVRFLGNSELSATDPYIILKKVRIVGADNGNGKPQGAVWTNDYPACVEFTI